MTTAHLIPANQFCEQYQIDISFIQALNESGLIQITTIEQTTFIPEDHLADLEKMIRLHYDLDINVAGIEAISHLLKRVEEMQHQMTQLQNRLRLYETSGESSI